MFTSYFLKPRFPMSIIPFFFSYLSEFREKVSGIYLGQRILLYGRKALKSHQNQTAKQQQKLHTLLLPPPFKQEQ